MLFGHLSHRSQRNTNIGEILTRQHKGATSSEVRMSYRHIEFMIFDFEEPVSSVSPQLAAPQKPDPI